MCSIPHTAASETAEKKSEEALAAANSALDIILGSSPRSPRPEITDFGLGSSNYNIADAWESTAFDVEKEVAAALKAALMLHTHDLENDEKLRIAGMSLVTITSPQSNLDSAIQPDWVVDHASEASTEDLNHGTVRPPNFKLPTSFHQLSPFRPDKQGELQSCLLISTDTLRPLNSQPYQVQFVHLYEP